MINSTELTWTSHSTRNNSVVGGFEGDYFPDESVPTVLVPGISATVLSLKSLTGALHEKDNEVVTIDVGKARGRLGHAVTMGKYVQFLMEAVHEEFDDQPVNLGGHSWGGVLVQKAALMYPDRVKKVAVMATIPGGVALYPPSIETTLMMMNPNRSQKRLDRVSGKLYGGDFRTNPDLANELDIAHPVDKEAYWRQYFAVIAGAGLYNQIHQIKQETLIIAGTDDPITPLQNSKDMHARIANSQLHIFEDEGHMFPMSKAEETAEILDAFLNETKRRITSGLG